MQSRLRPEPAAWSTKLSKYVDVDIVTEENCTLQHQPDPHEDGVDIPLDRIKPEILYNLIAEFVTREWEEIGDSPYTLEEKIDQVLRELQQKKAKVVFDLNTNSCNIVVSKYSDPLQGSGR